MALSRLLFMAARIVASNPKLRKEVQKAAEASYTKAKPYINKANENINRENTEINKDGISVNNPNEIIYFLFAIAPFTLMLFLIEFLISKKIKTKKMINNIKLNINRI